MLNHRLQLASYSRISVQTWWASARRLMHTLLPTAVDADGTLRRQPTGSELRLLRRRIFELAEAGDVEHAESELAGNAETVVDAAASGVSAVEGDSALGR